MRRLVTLLQRDQTIVRMGSDDLYVHSDALNSLPVGSQRFGAAGWTSVISSNSLGFRASMPIPLLEYLDRQRITRKQGDHRLVL